MRIMRMKNVAYDLQIKLKLNKKENVFYISRMQNNLCHDVDVISNTHRPNHFYMI